MTARHHLESARRLFQETQNPELITRRNNAKVLLVLTVVLIISYVPFYSFVTYFYFNINLDRSVDKLKEIMVMFVNFSNITSILRNLLSINSCLNPVARFCTSRTFRRHLKRYLTCCCKTNSPPTDLELANRN
jgi:hypothetical protein